MDREYGAAQLMALHQLAYFSGPHSPTDERKADLERILTRIVAWCVSHDDFDKRATDHSYWLFLGDQHPFDVVKWDQELSELDSEEDRQAATDRLRKLYPKEVPGWASEQSR
jgi:hypothetical protein